jgi:hypothetical protein
VRAPRVSGLLAVLLVASCGHEATAPPLAEPATVESTTATSVTVPASSSTGSTTPTSGPSATVSDPAATQTSVRESSTTTTTLARPLSGPIVLRGDGLGGARFGDPMLEVEPWLRSEAGDPYFEEVARAPLAASQWYEARDMLRVLTFILGMSEQTGGDTSLVVVFSDLSEVRDDGIVHLAGWATYSSGDVLLATPSGLAIGSSSVELQEQFPNVEFGLTDPYGLQDWFAIVSAETGEAGIRGLLSNEDRVIRLEAGADTLHPDDIPDSPQPPDGPEIPDLTLRSDGLGTTDVTAAAGDLVNSLTERFGPPAKELNANAPPGDTLRGVHGYWPETELRELTWYDPGLRIVVADGPVYGGTTPGDLRLVNWATTSVRPRLANGLGVGSALAEFTSIHPEVTVGLIEECAGAYYPRHLTITTDTDATTEGADWVWVHGTIAWDWVSDVQQALNERGATLAVDGEYGPRTTAAVAAFQTQATIDSAAPWDSNGEIGPQTLAALGLAAPGIAVVESLWAGYPSSC